MLHAWDGCGSTCALTYQYMLNKYFIIKYLNVETLMLFKILSRGSVCEMFISLQWNLCYSIWMISVASAYSIICLCCHVVIPQRVILFSSGVLHHTLMGMEEGVHVHLYAFLYGFASWMWWSILRYTMNKYVSHCAMAYRILDILYVGCMGYWDIGLM